MTNIYVHADLHEMHLYPCAYSMTFNVTKKPGDDILVLECHSESALPGCAGSQQLECGTVFRADAYAGTGV